MLASVGLAFAAVIMRYVFNFSLEWIEEGARYLALLAAFVVAGPVLRNRGHVALDLLTSRLRGTHEQMHRFAVSLVALVVGAAIFVWGVVLVLQTYQYGLLTGSLHFPQWLPYSIVPLGMAILVLFSVSEMIAAIVAMRAAPSSGSGSTGQPGESGAVPDRQ
jgi:TRAP-type C4-dicarboxylate transport system permease small subunit